MKRIIVAGAGISGLATAYRLANDDALEVRVFEARSRTGGTIGAVKQDGFMVETGPNGFLDSREEILSLCSELELDDKLERAGDTANKRFSVRKGSLVQLPSSPLSFLLTKALSPKGRARTMVEGLIRRGPESEDETLLEFATRRVGRECAERLIDAMVNGIYAGDPSLLSARSTFPRLIELERAHGSLTKALLARRREAKKTGGPKAGPAGPAGRLTSIAGGIGTLPETLADLLGDRLEVGRQVTGIERAKQGWRVTFEDDGQIGVEEADAVILATPAYSSGAVVDSIAPDLGKLLKSIAYAPISVVALGFERDQVKHPLDGFGFVTSGVDKLPILGSLWTSSIFRNRAPEGAVLLRNMIGGWRNQGDIELDDSALIHKVYNELDRLMDLKGDPIFSAIIRWPQGIPQYHVGHQVRLEKIEKSLQQHPGLFLTGNAYYGIGLNECVREGAKIAGRVLEFLS